MTHPQCLDKTEQSTPLHVCPCLRLGQSQWGRNLGAGLLCEGGSCACWGWLSWTLQAACLCPSEFLLGLQGIDSMVINVGICMRHVADRGVVHVRARAPACRYVCTCMCGEALGENRPSSVKHFGTKLTHTWLHSFWSPTSSLKPRAVLGQREAWDAASQAVPSPVVDFLPGIYLAELNPGKSALRVWLW